MLYVRLAGGHLYGEQLFTWLSLVVSLIASFLLSFFPPDVLDEIWDIIESVSERFLTYSTLLRYMNSIRSYHNHGKPGSAALNYCKRPRFCLRSTGKLNSNVGAL